MSEGMFRRLLAVRVVGQLQDGIIQSALASFVLFSPESQDSAAGVVAAFAVLLLPYSLIGPFMGVFLDRWRRRQVLLYANLARAAMVVGLILITILGAPTLLLGVVVLFVLGTNRLILTALAASIPNTVPAERLISANAVAPVSGTIGAAVGAAASLSLGAALGATATTTALLLGVAALGLVITAALSLRLPVSLLGPHGGEVVHESAGEVIRQLAHGAHTLWRAKRAWWSFWGVMAHRMAYGVALLLAIVASKNVLSPDDNAGALGLFGLAIAGAGAGAFLGAVVTPPIVRHWSAGWWSATTVILAALVATPGLLSVTAIGFVAGASLLGFAGQSVKIDTDTVVALSITDDIRGRVFSLLDVGINVSLLSGIALAGFLVPASGASAALSWTTGALLVASAAMFLLSGRRSTASVRRLDPTPTGNRDS